MNPLSPAENDRPNKSIAPLAERMDDAVGEATSMMGAVLTELLRRTLRGGVSQIGDGLNAYVSDQVDATIAERAPAMEKAAIEIADRTARTAAIKIVAQEVGALESRARQADEQLANQIQEAARTAKRLTAEATHGMTGRLEQTAQSLTGRIEQAAQSLTGRIEQAAESLTGRIEETHKHVEQTATATAQELTTRIHEAERSAEQRTRDTALGLSAQIAEAEKRAAETAQAEMARQMQDLLERSRKSVAALKARLDTLEGTTAALRTEAGALTQANQSLAARVAELEKPRGLLSGLMFWRKS